MATFEYEGRRNSLYGLINGGNQISKQLEALPEHRSMLAKIQHKLLWLVGWSRAESNITLYIENNNSVYEFNLIWNATKLKGDTLLLYLERIRNREEVDTGGSDWRQMINGALQWMGEHCDEIEIKGEKVDRYKIKMTLYAKASGAKLISPPKVVDEPDKVFDFRTQVFQSPLELLAEPIGEIVKEALKYFGKDNNKAIDILKPLEGKMFIADYLIGAMYYVFMDMPQKGYQYMVRAIGNIEQSNKETAAMLLDWLGNIEAQVKSNPEQAERNFALALSLGNQVCLLKLAYLYLREGKKENKGLAYNLTQASETVLPLDEDHFHQLAGYHIASSVYVWCNDYDSAEKAQQHFLMDENWCKENKEHVEAYLCVVMAKNNTDFISNLVSDYPVILSQFSHIIDVWAHTIVDPSKDGFQMWWIPYANKIRAAQRMYGE